MRLFFLITFFFWNCTHQVAEKSVGIPQVEGKPKIGFNCKASYQTPVQVALADSLFSLMSENALANMVLRIPGGTRSQKDFARDWPDARMKMWIDLQKKYGYQMVYVVNGNDSPANQLELIRRWQKNGAEFVFLEMMTEYYLHKFQKPLLNKPEVTRKVTQEDYTEEILPAFYQHLDSLNLPYYLIFAPVKIRRGIDRYAGWNDHMAEYVKNEKREVGAVLHLYWKDPDEPYDYDQIARLRKRLPKGMPIAVTEFGVLTRAIDQNRHAELSVDHAQSIVAQLGAGDFIMDQVLYNDYPGNIMGNTNPRLGGITLKGEAMVEYYNSLYP